MLIIDIEVADIWPDAEKLWHDAGHTACMAALRHTHYAHIADSPYAFELSLQFSNNHIVHELNHKWRGKDRPTNVLSFPMLEADDLKELASQHYIAENPEILLGDIILANEVCTGEAIEKEITVIHHAQHLVVHGTLHLLGYNHETDETAAEMESLEISILESMGISNPYLDGRA
jgi:probable rRNA maturation factor